MGRSPQPQEGRVQGVKAGGPSGAVVVLGPLMGGPQCRLSILRKGNVPCCYR